MSMTYSQYVTSCAAALSIEPETTLSGSSLLDRMIEYAELRIYRELDLLTTVSEATVDLVAGTRSASMPGSIIILNSASIITPASTAPLLGTRQPLQRTSVEFINFVAPTAATTGLPLYYAMQDNTTIILAPTPSAAYKLACLGVVRPAPLSSGNPTTYLTLYLPDLFFAASMVFGFGAITQNFGAQADDPQSAQSWENQYNLIKSGADLENLRSKAQSFSWQPYSPSLPAKESRT